MATTVLGKCPGCKQTVRLSEEWADKTIRCKNCGMVCQSKPGPAVLARQEARKPRPTPVMVDTARQPETVADTRPAAAPLTPAQELPVPTVPTAVVPVVPVNGTVDPAGAPVPGADAWSAIGDASYGDPSAPVLTPSYRRRSRGWITTIVGLALLAALLGGTAYAVMRWAPKIKEKLNEQARSGDSTQGQANNSAANVGNPDKPVDLPSQAGAFPRRLLGISINNYIFANPTSYGFDSRGFIKRDFGKTLDKFANKLRIPSNQAFELSDGAQGNRQNPPLKPVLEQTLTRFCETCRPQDRVIVILSAHTVEIDKKPYLIPLEGDKDEVKTLIPLEWIMEQLDKCPAQQKLLIADFNRFDKARGQERPTGGKLAASTEALLKNPPKGVQVWSACSAGQYSYEFDDYYDFGGQGIKGGAFLNLFSVVFLEGLKGIQKPDEPLPIDQLAQKINPMTINLSLELPDPDEESTEPAEVKKDEKKDVNKEEKKAGPPKRKPLQTPFLAGEMKGEPVPFNPEEPAPKTIAIPTPQEVYAKGVMARDDIRKLLDLFALPPIKQARSTDTLVRFDQVLPFTTEAMKDYTNDTSVDQIKKDPEKYPLRFAVVSALEKIRAIDAGEIALPDQLTEGDRTDAAKGNLARLQRGPARVMKDLEELMESLQKVVEERKEEKSKFWQATLDFVTAQVKARYVYVHEYTSVIGQVRKDILPELDKKKGHKGWRLASRESLATTDNAVKDLAKEARKIYTRLGNDHKGTPWEVLAKRERFTSLGLQWEVYGEANKAQNDPMGDSK